MLKDYGDYSKFYSASNCETVAELNAASVRTRTVFYVILAAVLLFFALLSVAFVVSSSIRRNIRSYMIHITLGATKGTVVLFAVFEILWFIIAANIVSAILLSIFCYFGVGWFSIVYNWFTLRFVVSALLAECLILLFAAAVAFFHLRKRDVSSLIRKG